MKSPSRQRRDQISDSAVWLSKLVSFVCRRALSAIAAVRPNDAARQRWGCLTRCLGHHWKPQGSSVAADQISAKRRLCARRRRSPSVGSHLERRRSGLGLWSGLRSHRPAPTGKCHPCSPGTRMDADTFGGEMIHRDEHCGLSLAGECRRPVRAPHDVHRRSAIAPRPCGDPRHGRGRWPWSFQEGLRSIH